MAKAKACVFYLTEKALSKREIFVGLEAVYEQRGETRE